MFAARNSLVSPLLALLAAAATVAAEPTTTPVEGLRQNTPTYHALVGAKIVAAPGKVIEKGTIVVRDGVITAIGPEVNVPKGAVVWDYSDRTIYPGFIDAYGEQTVEGATTTADGSWNKNVTPQFRLDQRYTAAADVNKKLRSQGFAVRVVAPTAGIIKGQSVVVTTADLATNLAVLRAGASLHVRLTPFRGGGPRSYPASPMGAVALVRQTFLDAQWYRRAWEAHHATAGVPRPEANDSLAALNRFLDSGAPIVVDASDVLYFMRADALGREFDLKVIVRGSGKEYQRIEAVKAAGRTVILPLEFPKPPNVTDAEAQMSVSLERLMHWDIAPENPARLAKAGVPIVLTTHGLKDSATFLTALRKAVSRGLSEDDALKALTTTPATLFGLSKQYGTLEAGKSASLTVVEGNLLGDKGKVIDSWVEGRRYVVQAKTFADIRGHWELTLPTKAKGIAEKYTLVLEGEPGKPTGKLLRGKKEAPLKNSVIDGTQWIGALKGDPIDLKGELQLSATILAPPASEGSKAPVPTLEGLAVTPDGRRHGWSGKRVEPPKTTTPAKETEAKPTETKQPAGDKKPATAKPDANAAKEPPKEDKPAATPTPKTPDDQPPKKPIEEQPAVKNTDAKPADAKPGKTKTTEQPKPAATPAGTKPVEPKPMTPKTGDDQPPKRPIEEKPKTPAGEPGTEKKPDDRKPDDKKQEEKKPEAPKTALYPVNYPLGDFGLDRPPVQHRLVAFTNATVWTCAEEGVVEGAVVLVERGKIKAVGRNVAVPTGAFVVDCRGKHLTPGIIDCHSHIATDGGVNEATQSITSEVRIGDFIDPHDLNIYRQLAGGVTAANILHGSANTIGGQNQVIKFRWGALAEEMKFAAAPAGIKFALGENVKQSNWGADSSGRYPQSRMGVEQLLIDAFQAAKDYKNRRLDYRRNKRGLPPRVDLELEALVEVLEGERLIHCHSYRQDEILAFLRVCEAFHVRVATLQHILEGYKVADVMARHGAGGSSFSDWWAYKYEVWDAIPYNGALMHDAGVVVSFNSDDAELARRLNLEAAKAVKYGGVKPEEALKFVTLNPARQLGIDKYVGSIEPGKDADLALWNGSPLSSLARCEQTWVDGRKYFDRADDLKRRDEMAKRRAALVQRALASGEAADDGSSDRGTMWDREDIYCGCRSPHRRLEDRKDGQ